MSIRNISRPSSNSRRALLAASAGIVLPLIAKPAISGKLIRAIASGRDSPATSVLRPDLYVFNAPRSNNWIMAVLFPAIPTAVDLSADKAVHLVRFHAGDRSWDITTGKSERLGGTSNCKGIHIFSGNVRGRIGETRGVSNAVVVEAPREFARYEAVPIWAEVVSGASERSRAGHPLVTTLAVDDPELHRLRASVQSADDQAAFADVVAGRVSRIAERAAYVIDPHAHGMRVAARTMPDAISFWPGLPVGFNFAHQNGRHPDDDTHAVVDALLTGTVARRTVQPAFGLSDVFPYFTPVRAIV
jgi:hypothetical protein